MGKIVINKTDEKQTIILTNDSEGVSGVYFGEDGVEKTLGEPGVPMKTYKIKQKTVVNDGNHPFSVLGTISHYSNWSQRDLPITWLGLSVSGENKLGAKGQCIRNNNPTDIYLNDNDTGNPSTNIHDDTRLTVYIPEEYMEYALTFLEEVEE